VCAAQTRVSPRSPVWPARETSQRAGGGRRLWAVIIRVEEGKECLVKEKRGEIAAGDLRTFTPSRR